MDQKIKDLILRRRLQLLVHSCIYYHLDQNVIADGQWDQWARELVDLQRDHPEESKQVDWYQAFKDWDASTGAFLPITDPWVVSKAHYILKICKIPKIVVEPEPVKKPVKKVTSVRKKLF